MKKIVLLDLDCFFVQVEQQKNPQLKNQCVAVHQHGDVIAASYQGIKIFRNVNTNVQRAARE